MTVHLNDMPPYEPDFHLRAGGVRMTLEPHTWKRLKGILLTAAVLAVAVASALAGTHL